MIFSFTGLSYLILSFSAALLAYRFFQYWQQKKDATSRLFFYFIFCVFSFTFYRSIIILFFSESNKALASSIIFNAFMQGLAASIAVYLAFYVLKISKTFSQISFFIVFLYTLFVTWLTIDLQKDANGIFVWGPFEQVPPYYSVLRFILLFLALAPLAIILFQQYKKTADKNTKNRTIGLAISLIVGIIVGFIDFIVQKNPNISLTDRDIGISILGIFLFAVVYFTQKAPSNFENYEKL